MDSAVSESTKETLKRRLSPQRPLEASLVDSAVSESTKETLKRRLNPQRLLEASGDLFSGLRRR